MPVTYHSYWGVCCITNHSGWVVLHHVVHIGCDGMRDSGARGERWRPSHICNEPIGQGQLPISHRLGSAVDPKCHASPQWSPIECRPPIVQARGLALSWVTLTPRLTHTADEFPMSCAQPAGAAIAPQR